LVLVVYFLKPIWVSTKESVDTERILFWDSAEYAFLDKVFEFTGFEHSLVDVILGFVDFTSDRVLDLDFIVDGGLPLE
jgi:hypothetical protein